LAGEKTTPSEILNIIFCYGMVIWTRRNNFNEKIIQLSKTAEKLEISDDEIGSPTHTWDLAQMTMKKLKLTIWFVSCHKFRGMFSLSVDKRMF
jgi:dTDP-4-dehydrorhamnose reductase